MKNTVKRFKKLSATKMYTDSFKSKPVKKSL